MTFLAIGRATVRRTCRSRKFPISVSIAAVHSSASGPVRAPPTLRGSGVNGVALNKSLLLVNTTKVNGAPRFTFQSGSSHSPRMRLVGTSVSASVPFGGGVQWVWRARCCVARRGPSPPGMQITIRLFRCIRCTDGRIDVSSLLASSSRGA